MGHLTPNLKDMQVLVIDCQTSGSNVERSHLLEIGWLPVRAADNDANERHLPCVRIIKPPDDWQLPAPIEKLTGIGSQELKEGVPPERAWLEFCVAARRIAARYGLQRCPAVIHFARFEMGFIDRLASQYDTDEQNPIMAICTHQIASRMLPMLPRKGLRAVAGYLGHSMGKHKRCLDHLLATRTIWQHMVRRLETEYDITTLEQLRQWLKIASQTVPVKRTYPMPKEARSDVPQTPGVYYLQRSNGDLLYIGKAANLRQRINSYFHSGARHSEKTLEMLSQAVNLEVTPTPSALEAAILESDQIKQHEPPYNLALTSDHRQVYFISHDFTRRRARPDKTCKLGPVLSFAPFEAAANIVNHLAADRPLLDAAAIPHILAMPQHYCPDPERLLDGLALFKAKHHGLLYRTNALSGLMRIGRWSWIEKMSQKHAQQPAETDDQEGADEPFVWTPDAVVKTLEAIVRQCGFLLRRARWLAMLSEATLAWRERSQVSDQTHVIIINGGSVAVRYKTKSDQLPPEPTGASLAFRDRQANLNLRTYDRLRVLTTEIRRLITEQRPLCIRIRKTVCLHESQLEALLKWV